jgi:hypothetical protein
MALSEALLLAGELEKALTVGTQALERTRTHAERGAEAHACWLLATIHSARAIDLDAAAGMFGTATATATELGLLPLLAHCHLGFGELHERQGLRPKAIEHRNRGQDHLVKMGMKPWFKL